MSTAFDINKQPKRTFIGYHTTDLASKNLILRKGFRPSNEGFLGQAIYFWEILGSSAHRWARLKKFKSYVIIEVEFRTNKYLDLTDPEVFQEFEQLITELVDYNGVDEYQDNLYGKLVDAFCVYWKKEYDVVRAAFDVPMKRSPRQHWAIPVQIVLAVRNPSVLRCRRHRIVFEKISSD